jgi:hypothetical protein
VSGSPSTGTATRAVVAGTRFNSALTCTVERHRSSRNISAKAAAELNTPSQTTAAQPAASRGSQSAPRNGMAMTVTTSEVSICTTTLVVTGESSLNRFWYSVPAVSVSIPSTGKITCIPGPPPRSSDSTM